MLASCDSSGQVGRYVALVNIWIARPTDPSPRRWHLLALIPPEHPLAYAACGVAWATSEEAPLERTEDLNEIPETVRCEDCQRVYAGRIQGWI